MGRALALHLAIVSSGNSVLSGTLPASGDSSQVTGLSGTLPHLAIVSQVKQCCRASACILADSCSGQVTCLSGTACIGDS